MVESAGKKKHDLKVENYVLFGSLLRTIAWDDSLSGSFEGLFQRGKGGHRIYRSFSCLKKHEKQETRKNKNIKRLLLITKTRHLKLEVLLHFCL